MQRLPTVDQRHIQMITSQGYLDLLNRNSVEFLRNLITVDETRIHHYMPEAKQQFKQWLGESESALKKAKRIPSTTIF